jgi:hypothetical protein
LTATPAARQQVIASLAVLPFETPTPVVFSAGHPDAAILTAWNTRQNALAAIERRGRFYTCEEHSPHDAAAFELAEEYIGKSLAKTPEGLLAKMWVALSLAGGGVRYEWQQVVQDIIRRADFNEVALWHDRLDLDQQVIFTVLFSFAAQAGGRRGRR